MIWVLHPIAFEMKRKYDTSLVMKLSTSKRRGS